MGDFTTHLKLINTIAKAVAEPNLPKEHAHSALISRKTSTMYYPMLHLELVRYVAHAGRGVRASVDCVAFGGRAATRACQERVKTARPAAD
ncbi:hypothetical protein C8R44DRAFT_921266 [Mycena epipterygia]|nr:hypothetical protein C8R44DRAFT_921266 [Mycena epipterygia]